MLNIPQQPTIPKMPVSVFQYKGTCTELPESEKPGTILHRDGKPYLYVDEWIDINVADKLSESSTPKPTNCPSCGAPLDRHKDRCEYCGTEWRLRL